MAEDMTGARYGIQTVLGRAERGGWVIRCDCGTEKVKTAQQIRITKSCGCLMNAVGSRRLAPGMGAVNDLYGKYRRQALSRGYVFELSLDQFMELTSQPCYYCGAEPAQEWGYKTANGNYTYNGVDRANNALGYLYANCLPCCGTCNILKGSMSKDEFIEHIRKIARNLRG